MGIWTVDRVRARCGLLPPTEYQKMVPRHLLLAHRRTGLSTELMLTAAVLALNGNAICWTAYNLRHAQEQVKEIKRMVYLCDLNCRSRITPRGSSQRHYPPGVRLGDHYRLTRPSSSSSSDPLR